jgi:hypothetical protein
LRRRLHFPTATPRIFAFSTEHLESLGFDRTSVPYPIDPLCNQKYSSIIMASFFDVSFDPGQFVALIPTLMSVVGSVNIARLVKRSPSIKEGSYTKRILMGMSICEVVSCIAFSAQSLFIPRESSHFLWAIGNGSALGLMMQFSISSYIFSCFLSFIYLSKIRLDYNTINRDFVTRRIEPWMGTLGLCYPLMTAFIGAAMQFYSNMEFLPSSEDSATSEATLSHLREISSRIGHFLFPGYPITNLLAAVAFNSFVIFAFVWSPLGQKRSKDWAPASQTNGVATAAVLLTYVWTAILRVFESNDISHFSKGALYPLILLQAVLLPALGLYNASAWFEPRMKRVQSLYPFESTSWCLVRTLIGDKMKPNKIGSGHSSDSFSLASRRRCRF